MIVGSAVVQGSALAAAVLVAKRAAGAMWAILWSLVGALSYVPAGSWILLEAWNPHLAYPFFLLFAVLAWRCACVPGSYAAWVVVVGSILVQLHIGYLPLVGAVCLWLLWTYWRASASEVVREPARPALFQIGIATLLLWMAPLIEALMDRGGNVRHLAGYFLLGKGQESRAGLSLGARLFATEFQLPPPWLGGNEDKDPLTALTTGSSLVWLLLPVVVIAIGIGVFKRSERPLRSAMALSWTLLGSGLVALVLLRGKVAPYLFYWRIPVAVLVVATVVAALWSLLAESKRRTWRTVAASSMVVVVAVTSIGFAMEVERAPADVMVFESIARELVGQVAVVPDPVIVRWVGSPESGLQAGVIDALDRRGAQVGVDVGGGFQWGDHREIRSEDASEIWIATEQGFVTAAVERLPGARVIAKVSPLTPDEDAELSALQNEARKELQAVGRPDVIGKLDSPLAVFDLDALQVLDEAQRRRFTNLSEKVVESGIYRAAIIAFPPSMAPSSPEVADLG